MKTNLIIFATIFSAKILAQSPVIEQYIAEGIANNQSLKQQKFQLQKSIYQLEEAKTLFRPNINLNTTYSTAAGGRNISFPVGDLINPIYSTLNLLTPANFPKFPEGQIPNVNEQLVPKNFYDARIKTQMPLFNAEIKYNQKIKQQQLGIQEAEIQVFKRELVKEIKVAYFNFMKASEALKIYANAKKLLAETERVNKSLIKNEIANQMVLTKTQNEQARLEAETLNAQNNLINSATYFNFLLNKPFENEIVIDSTYSKITADYKVNSNGIREELLKLKAAIEVNETLLAMNKAYRKPKIGTILDVGSQGSLKDINAKNPFLLFGLSLDLPIYAGGRNKLKILQQEQEVLALAEQEKTIKNQLFLQAEIANNNLKNQINQLPAKQYQVITAKKYHADILKKYKEGQINYVELFEAQTQILNAELQNTIAIYDTWIKHTELERAKASFNLK